MEKQRIRIEFFVSEKKQEQMCDHIDIHGVLLITQALTVHRYFFDIYVGLVPFFVVRPT